METVVLIAIILLAAAYTGRSLYRKASLGKKSCACEDGCPISERCRPEDSKCVIHEIKEDAARSRGEAPVR